MYKRQKWTVLNRLEFTLSTSAQAPVCLHGFCSFVCQFVHQVFLFAWESVYKSSSKPYKRVTCTHITNARREQFSFIYHMTDMQSLLTGYSEELRWHQSSGLLPFILRAQSLHTGERIQKGMESECVTKTRCCIRSTPPTHRCPHFGVLLTEMLVRKPQCLHHVLQHKEKRTM